MTLIKKALLGTALAAGALAFVSTTASAAIVCSGNVCWHVTERYDYPPEAKVTIYEDSWRWSPHEKYRWREREGRGYWRDDRWITW